jgi:hypothetical protein
MVTSSSWPSSLQRTAIKDVSKLTTVESIFAGNRDSGSGGFESCFAQGLDFSEFGGNNSNGKNYNNKSAAEELLQIKEKERKQRTIQEQEEIKMQEALQKRLKSIKDNQLKIDNDNKNVTRSSSQFEVVDALVRMHDTDDLSTMISSHSNNNNNNHKKNNNNNRKGIRRTHQQQKSVGRSSSSSSSRMSAKNNNNNSKPSLLKKKRHSKF